jgi:hypothetical protein
VFEVDKKYEGSDKESSDEDSQEDDDIEKYNPGELIGDISVSLLWFLVFVIIMIISVVRDVSYQFPRIVLLDVIIFLTILV